MADPEAPDRQSRRDRASHPSRLPRNGHQDGRGAFDRRHRRDARAARRRDGLHRPAAGERSPISTSPTSSRPPRSSTPTRSIPATASSRENAQFAEIVESHNIIWVGPKPEHIRTMGDKIEAKRTAAQARPAARPRLGRAVDSDRARPRRSPREIGYPVLIKAASGGGGRGMKVVPVRRPARKPDEPGRSRSRARRSATTPSTWKNISPTRATSSSRYSATARAMRSISASATARSSAATRRCSRKRPPP